MNKYIEEAVTRFLESERIVNDEEIAQRAYDFKCGAKSMLKKIFELYIDDELEFSMTKYE